MGTRGFTGYKADGKWLVTYNHYDSYPSYLGQRVIDFCREMQGKWEDVKSILSNVKMVESDEIPTPDMVERYKSFADYTVNDGQSWYCLLRELQGIGILRELASGNCQHMIDNHEFMNDSLFAEWGYIIDLDEKRLIIYKGFNARAVGKKWSAYYPPDILLDTPSTDEPGSTFVKRLPSGKTKIIKRKGWKYYPVRVYKVFPLDNLPLEIEKGE